MKQMTISMFLLNFMFLISDLLPLPEEVSDAVALMSVLAAKFKCSLSVRKSKAGGIQFLVIWNSLKASKLEVQSLVG